MSKEVVQPALQGSLVAWQAFSVPSSRRRRRLRQADYFRRHVRRRGTAASPQARGVRERGSELVRTFDDPTGVQYRSNLQIAQLENALWVLLGRNPGPIPRGKTILELALPQVPAGVPSQLLERRPDLLQAEQQLIAANAQIGAAKALYFPTISLTGAVGGASLELNDLFKGPSRVWSYGGSIIGPIFTGGAISGQVAQATAGQQAALFAYELAIQSAFADVETALVSRQKLAEQIAAQERLVQALREYSRLAQLLFDGGRESHTTVLQAQQQLFPEELNLAAQRAQLYASLVGIYRATGGGWVNEAGKFAPQPLAVKR